jgi:GT2 family glycosyltransferase
MPPKISILTATYNRPALLREAVQSVLQQTFTDLEYIVVNDGGVEVGQVLAEFKDPRIVYLSLEKNQGKAHALNQALKIARGEYIGYLDDDDHFFPDHVEILINAISAHPEADLVYSDFEEVNYEKDAAGNRVVIDRSVRYSRDFDREALFKENYIPHPTIVHRRDLLEKHGGFDASFPCLIDWELLRRLAFYADFLHVKQVTGEYYINRRTGDHITNLHSDRPQYYMEHFFRIRRKLPPKPWRNVESVSLFVRPHPRGDAPATFFSRLLHATIYPCEIFLCLQRGEDDAVLADKRADVGGVGNEWLEKMNIAVIRGEDDAELLRKAAQCSTGELIVTMDTTQVLYKGWLSSIVERRRIQSERQPFPLKYQSVSTPWGWVLTRRELLSADWHRKASLDDHSADYEKEVSVIIPVRNKKELTEQCLASIRRTQPRVSYEIIVVDNASDDGTTEMLERLQGEGFLTWIRNDPPLPFAASCNRGAAAARGRYLLFLNNDTIALPGWLEELYNIAATTPDVGAVGAKLLFPDGTIQHAGVAFHRFKRQNIVNPHHIFRSFPGTHPAVNKIREFQVVTGACLLTPHSIFKQLGGFDARYTNCFEDVDYCLNLCSRDYKVIYTPYAELIHLEGQTPGRNDAIFPSRVLLQEKWGDFMVEDEQNYLPGEGFSIEENDQGMIFICEESELRQWKEAIAQLIELQQWLMALEEIDRLEQVVGTQHADILEMRGLCALKLGDIARARKAFYRAQTLDPASPGPKWGLAQVAVQKQKPVEARARLRRLISDYPGDPRSNLWQKALQDLDRIEESMLEQAVS